MKHLPAIFSFLALCVLGYCAWELHKIRTGIDDIDVSASMIKDKAYGTSY